MPFRRSARIRELGAGISKEELVSFLETRGLPIHVGRGGPSVSLVVSEGEETAVATVTFKDYDALNRAVVLPSDNRRLKDGSVMQIDADFDGFTALSNGPDIEYVV